MGEQQPMPTFEEKGTETVSGRLAEVRGTISNLEQQLVEAKGAADITVDDATREDQEDLIDEIEEALEHLRDEEKELVAANTDAAADEEAAA